MEKNDAEHDLTDVTSAALDDSDHEDEPKDEVNAIADIFDDQTAYDEYFGILKPSDLIVIRSYNGDDDDEMLSDLQPRFIVMYDPEPAFVRRIEVCVDC